MTLRRKLILISFNFEKYILHDILHGWNVHSQTWDAITLKSCPQDAFLLHEHGLSTHSVPWSESGPMNIQRCIRNSDCYWEFNLLWGQKYMNNEVNHEKFNLLKIQRFAMGVLRTAQLILMDYVKEGLEEEGK